VGRSASESGSNGPGRSFFFAFFSARTINLAAVYQRRRRTVPDSRGTSDGRWPRRVVHAAARGRTGGLPSCVTLSVLALSKIREEYVRCATCKLRGPRDRPPGKPRQAQLVVVAAAIAAPCRLGVGSRRNKECSSSSSRRQQLGMEKSMEHGVWKFQVRGPKEDIQIGSCAGEGVG